MSWKAPVVRHPILEHDARDTEAIEPGRHLGAFLVIGEASVAAAWADDHGGRRLGRSDGIDREGRFADVGEAHDFVAASRQRALRTFDGLAGHGAFRPERHDDPGSLRFREGSLRGEGGQGSAQQEDGREDESEHGGRGTSDETPMASAHPA